MASTSHNSINKPIDPLRPAKYPVVLGKSISEKDAQSKEKYTSIRYNHKPSYNAKSRKALITHSTKASNMYKLSMTNKDDQGQSSTFTYAGQQRNAASGSYILIFDPQKQVFRLEALASEFNFNLTSAPWEANEKVLAESYSQLDGGHGSGSEDDDIELADGSANEGPDLNNPYDYRHFLKERPTSPSSDSAPTPEATSTHKAATIATRAPQRETLKSRPKLKERPKVAQPKRRPSPPPKEAVHIDNGDASEGDEADESSDDGDLIIEMDTDTKPNRLRPNILGSTLPSSKAPISLRSAASSLSPESRRPVPLSSSSEDSDANAISDNEHDLERPKPLSNDEDVDMLALPSPAVVPTPGDADDDDEEHDEELERALAQALENDEGAEEEGGGEMSVIPSSQLRADETESESEEE